MWFSIITGLSIGFLGSFHCIGMCGPIALSLPIHNKKKSEKTLVILLYNLGRAVTYAAFGAVLGFISNRFAIVGYQQIVSIIAGALILLFLILTYVFPNDHSLFGKFHLKIQNALSKALYAKKNNFSYFIIGLLNGLLPCGLVYLAVATAITTGSALNGALLMFAFGLGTFPLMISLLVAGNYISMNVRKKVRKLVPYFIGFMAVLLILRGMNLGIPHVSPALNNVNKTEAVQCH